MTRQRSFKRIVRARMQKTGESYTTARAALLTAQDTGADATAAPTLVTTDAKIRERTGRGWEQWFDLLDEWGAAERSHREIARHVAGLLEAHPLAWNAQAVAASYERARGLREVGERADGFAVTASKTVGVPAGVLFDAFVDEDLRARWLPAAQLHERTATRPRSARFDWDDGESRVHVTFAEKGEGRATAVVSHERLRDAAEAERMKTFWRGHIATLKEMLEG
jgi:uncharacterized protein YndB with AHSA1/START domain